MAGEQRQAEARPGQARFSSSTPPQETVVKQQQLTHALTPVRVRVHATRARMCSGKANGDRIEAEEGGSGGGLTGENVGELGECRGGAGGGDRRRRPTAVAEEEEICVVDDAPKPQSGGADDEVDDGEPHGHGKVAMGSRWPRDR